MSLLRKIFFVKKGEPTTENRVLRNYFNNLELRITDAFKLVAKELQTITDAIDSLQFFQVIHQTVSASEAVDGYLTIDFNDGLSCTLELDEELTLLTLIPPTLDSDRASVARLQIRQAGGGNKEILNWAGALFPDDEPPVLSDTEGFVDVICAVVDGTDNLLRFCDTPGFTS